MSGIETAFFGALGADAERKISKSGKPYLRFTVRVENDDAVTWVSVLCFDSDAHERADRMVKGTRVYIEGRLSTSEWTAQDGAKRFGLSVMSWHCRLAQIGRNRVKREAEKVSVAAGKTYHSPCSAPEGRWPSSDFNDEIPW